MVKAKNMSSSSLKWQDVDNYILVVATFLGLIAYTFSNPTIAFGIIAAGLLMKAIVSAIDPTVTSIQNLDNVALGIAAILALLADSPLLSNPTVALYLIVAGSFIKAVASAYTRGLDVGTNVDNIIFALGSAFSAAFIAFNQPQAAAVAVTLAALIKGLTSTYFRNKATTQTSPTPTPTPTPTPAPVPTPAVGASVFTLSVLPQLK